MAQTAYDLYEELGSLNALLESYHGWFFSVLNRVIYPAEYAGSDELPIPSLFVETLVAMSGADMAMQEASRLRELDALHHRLEELAEKLVAAASSGAGIPGHGEFDKFTGCFKVFINGIQKTCQNLILEEWGLDVLTGLKNIRVMEKELAQEMERLSRHGRSFSLALARIDDFDEIEALGPREADQYIKRVALFIGRSLRSFDAAYRLDRQNFIMALKQADIIGGKKALERLRNELERADISYRGRDGAKRPLTMSCCVAEPLPEDSIPVLIDDLRKDLDTQGREPGVVLTYYEVSPLQRFMQGRGGE